MRCHFKLEKALGALVLITLVAIVGERPILETTRVIGPDSGYTVAVYNDASSGGNSKAELLGVDTFEWRCLLRSGYVYSYCGFEVLFDPDRQEGLDLGDYDRIRIWLDYDGPSPTVRVYLRNFDPRYSTPGVNDSTKYNHVEFDSALTKAPLEFTMGDFFVANWWFQQHQIAPQLAHPQFDNIVVFEVQTGSGQHLGEHRFQLHRVELAGQIIPTETWYQIIMAIWLLIALVFLGVRVVNLNQALRRQKLREQELMEVNALLDVRSKKLEEMSKTDPLTGAFNRQGIEDAIKAGLTEWRHKRKPLSIVMLDLDHFKDINDTHGHAAGDHILTGLSDLVKKGIRASDLFARWGGEEFVLVCQDTDVDGAARIAEKLRALIAAREFEGGIKVTASFGVATLRMQESLDQLFLRTDTALYEAKRQGRDRVAVSSGHKGAYIYTKTSRYLSVAGKQVS